jgi:AraC-like DNA-binding protein
MDAWDMRSVSRPPHPRLRLHVHRYTGFTERSSEPVCRREVPVALIPLIISFGPRWRLIDPVDAARSQHRGSFVAGLHTIPALVEHAGESAGMQIDFTPLGAHMLFALPMHSLANRVVELEDVAGRFAAELVERLFHAPSWEARFDLLDTVIARRLLAARPTSPAVWWAWRRLSETRGSVPIGSLADELGWSHRRLISRFREQVGLPPKAVARVLRFEQAVQALASAEPGRWADVAYDGGYYDQAHFNRDFRALAGVTPHEYVACIAPGERGVLAA